MEQTSDFHAASLTWLLEAPAPDAPDSAELVFLFQPVTHWTVTFVLGWTCRPAGCQKSFSSDSDEPSALTSSGLATTIASARLPSL